MRIDRHADPYLRLARHLDDLPAGFPTTSSGVELRILRRLFSPEEASLAIHVTPLPEPAITIARRARLPLPAASAMLEGMAQRGLVYRLRRGAETLYSANQFVIGIWEFSLNSLDPDLIRDANEYFPTLFQPEIWRKAPQLRTIPISGTLPVDRPVLPYEDARLILHRHSRIAVAPCICRREHRLMGKGCHRPEETCLILGATADYYVENGLGRHISLDEALEILRLAEDSALVLQAGSSQRPGNICCCCGCCCQVLKAFQRHPAPATIVSSQYSVAADQNGCIGCGVCLERCQMSALSLKDGIVTANLAHCIGCGLCVAACPAGALRLVRKPPPLAPRIPRNTTTAYLRLALARGRILPLVSQLLRVFLSRLALPRQE